MCHTRAQWSGTYAGCGDSRRLSMALGRGNENAEDKCGLPRLEEVGGEGGEGGKQGRW